jgi:hypothetical protein
LDYTFRSQFIIKEGKAGTQGRPPCYSTQYYLLSKKKKKTLHSQVQQESWRMLLSSWPRETGSYLASFLIQVRTTHPGNSASPGEGALLHQLRIKTIFHRYAHRSIWSRELIEVFLSSYAKLTGKATYDK